MNDQLIIVLMLVTMATFFLIKNTFFKAKEKKGCNQCEVNGPHKGKKKSF
ncbi:MAG: hypothetical protein RIQ89_2069 [Bacteroidota bacterium]|jgi:hypothetical protein